jgi:hypothetical protein
MNRRFNKLVQLSPSLQNIGLVELPWNFSIVPKKHCDLEFNPIFH